ncbi:glycosyltransferase family 4 protein [candidate division KSB1 bacterium]|nr:glycosyltransferase family 4 protein [candidate division KSB1 bacterium]
MNILELCLSPDYGGLEIHMRDFSRWLSQKPECTLSLSLREGSRLEDALQPLQRPILTFPKKAGKFPLAAAKKLAKFIVRQDIDVVHVHWKNDLPLAALTKSVCSKKFKLVHTRQMNMPGKKKGLYHQYIYRSLDLFIAITKYLQKQAEAHLPLTKEKIRQIYYGVDMPEHVTPERTAELKKRFKFKDKFHVGLFGRIDEYKGQHLLLEAVEQLTQQGLDIHAGIVGAAFDPNYEQSLRERAKEKGLENRFHFFGFYDMPIELMTCFDTIVLTTKNETFGLVLIEAMFAGIAVIGSNAGGVPEIIDHEKTGLLFETWNADDLAQKIKRLAEEAPFRQALAAAGQKKAHEQFNLDIQYEKFYQALKSVL